MLTRRTVGFSLQILLHAACIDAAPYDFTDNYKRPAVPDKSSFPAQICGVVGAYVGTVLIWGILLLTIGRKMRRDRENTPKALELSLVTAKPDGRTPASPHSARSATSWFKRGFKSSSKTNLDSAIGSPDSPVVHSPSSFDQKVLDADRDKAQQDMERLYAAVMEHDRKKSYSQVSTEETDHDDRRRPSRIDTSRDANAQSNPTSPVKAIYPPGYHNGAPSAPLQRDRYRDNSSQPPASPRSILSKKSMNSQHSSSSKTRFNLKNLRISGPIQKYPDQGPDDEARTPLSPRFYNKSGQPSPPTNQHSPTTPADHEDPYLEQERLDEVQPLPRPAPQRLNSIPNSQSQTPTSAHPPSATSSNQSLPLRTYSEPLKSPDLRTTVLDRRLDKLSATTPKTGVPYTPYSPYMPYTPLTPVTPHLVTKKERKERKKVEGRRGRGVPSERDLVQSPKEIFGDAY